MTEEELKKVKAERPVLTCEEAAEFIKQHCCPDYPDKVDGTRWETVMHMAIEALKERKTGKWIKDTYGNVVCSECRANRRDNRIGHIAFCNSCGTKMEVEE